MSGALPEKTLTEKLPTLDGICATLSVHARASPNARCEIRISERKARPARISKYLMTKYSERDLIDTLPLYQNPVSA